MLLFSMVRLSLSAPAEPAVAPPAAMAMPALAEAGYHVVNADVTILAERPRLKPFKPQMVEPLTALLSHPGH